MRERRQKCRNKGRTGVEKAGGDSETRVGIRAGMWERGNAGGNDGEKVAMVGDAVGNAGMRVEMGECRLEKSGEHRSAETDAAGMRGTPSHPLTCEEGHESEAAGQEEPACGRGAHG